MGAGGSAGPAAYRVEVVRGESVDLEILVQQDGAPLDLTGADIQWRLYDCANVVHADASVDDGIEIADQLDPDTVGIFTISLAAADTDVPAGTYTHEAWLTLGAIRAAVIPPSVFVITSALLGP